MKTATILLTLLLAVSAAIYFTPAKESVTNWYYVNVKKTGNENSRIPLPDSEFRKIRMDSWALKRMLQTPILVCEIYNGSDWILSSIDVEVTSGTETRTMRCFFAITAEQYGNFAYGSREFIGPLRSSKAVSDAGSFVSNDSRIRIIKAYGWKN